MALFDKAGEGAAEQVKQGVDDFAGVLNLFADKLVVLLGRLDGASITLTGLDISIMNPTITIRLAKPHAD